MSLHDRPTVQRYKVAEARHLSLGPEQEVHIALRSMVRDGMLGAVLLEGLTQRVVMTDRAPPHRALIVWNNHNFDMALSEAQRIRGLIYRDVGLARADPEAMHVLLAGGWTWRHWRQDVITRRSCIGLR